MCVTFFASKRWSKGKHTSRHEDGKYDVGGYEKPQANLVTNGKDGSRSIQEHVHSVLVLGTVEGVP